MTSKPGFSFSLCADDFALSVGVSEGILKALDARRLSATSAMTTMRNWPQAARTLRAHEFDADIGLHFNLTQGAPLTPMPVFAPERQFPKVGQIIRLAQSRKLPEAEIRAEIAAQLDAFVEHYGRAPDFVDGHQHVQILPGIRLWLLEALAERGYQGKVWLRDSGDRLAAILARKNQIKKAFIVRWLSRGFSEAAASSGFATNRGFAGFSAFDIARDYGKAFATYLKAPGAAHLVMCHPGFVDAELQRLDPVTYSRRQELDFLLSSRFEDCLGRRGAKLTRFARACPAKL